MLGSVVVRWMVAFCTLHSVYSFQPKVSILFKQKKKEWIWKVFQFQYVLLVLNNDFCLATLVSGRVKIVFISVGFANSFGLFIFVFPFRKRIQFEYNFLNAKLWNERYRRCIRLKMTFNWLFNSLITCSSNYFRSFYIGMIHFCAF